MLQPSVLHAAPRQTCSPRASLLIVNASDKSTFDHISPTAHGSLVHVMVLVHELMVTCLTRIGVIRVASSSESHVDLLVARRHADGHGGDTA
jgi:hypothetical protein